MLGTEPLSLLASLHGFTQNEMFEARLVLEVGVAGLAAEHTSPEQLATMAEEVTEMFASLEDPTAFLLHDVRFHRAVAAGCGNRVLAALMEMVSAQFYELRKETISRARDLRESAEMHRRVYRAVRTRDSEAARAAMYEHLKTAQHAQTLERERETTAAAEQAATRSAQHRSTNEEEQLVGHPSLDLTGRVAVVVGGTSGIGRALVARPGRGGRRRGRQLAHGETVDATAAEIEARGRRTLRVTADVTDRASLEAARDAVVAAFGKIDILVNCAGRTKRAPTLELAERSGAGSSRRT